MDPAKVRSYAAKQQVPPMPVTATLLKILPRVIFLSKKHAFRFLPFLLIFIERAKNLSE